MVNDELLEQIKKIVADGTTPIYQRLGNLEQGQAQIKTVVEATAAGQAEIKETMATKADVQDLKATAMKKVNDHENRIADIEKDAGIPHPHKH